MSHPHEYIDFISSVVASTADIDEIALSANDSIDTVEHWDSLVTVNMAIALSDRFGITVGVDDLDELTSVEGILGVIERSI